MTVCFTGHRPQSLPFGFDETHPDCVNLKNRLSDEIGKLIAQGATTFYTGMAQGIDTFAAEAVLQYKKTNPAIRLIAAIPCPDQAIKWRLSDQKRYNSILAQCDQKVLVSPNYHRGCMHQRNRFMVDNAHVLIAVYDGTSKGGTAYTVNYAKEKGLTVIELIP
ncbi:MAG: DUF1273 family protein [Clostridia bacterium]|nr:DUF1273 family protein [Clostridia bacterium]